MEVNKTEGREQEDARRHMYRWIHSTQRRSRPPPRAALKEVVSVPLASTLSATNYNTNMSLANRKKQKFQTE